MAAASILYIDEPGAKICKDHGLLVIEKEGERLAETPLDHLEQLVLHGAVDCTGAALIALLRAGVDVCFLDYYGHYQGRLTSDRPRNCGLRLAQYRAFEDSARRIAFARQWVQAKIANQRTLLQRCARGRTDLDLSAEVAQMSDLCAQVEQAPDLDALRGCEGLAARGYFSGFARLLRPPWTLDARRQHPATDPVNALLSLGYGLLRRRVETAVSLAGLDPTIGFLHEPHPGRFSMALDLMEEFRPVLSDSAVLLFLNRQQVRPEQFEATTEGMRLGESGRERFFQLFESRLATEVAHPATGQRRSYRRHLDDQARRLAAALQGQGQYLPFVVR